MSKDGFFLMRAEQMASLYDSSFTKKDAVETGKKLTKQVFEAGEVNVFHYGANLARLSEVINSALSEFKNSISIDKTKELGVEFNHVQSSETLNFKDDNVWSDIKEELIYREEILKTAYKSKNEIYDENGILVPKVSSSVRKGYVTIKF